MRLERCQVYLFWIRHRFCANRLSAPYKTTCSSIAMGAISPLKARCAWSHSLAIPSSGCESVIEIFGFALPGRVPKINGAPLFSADVHDTVEQEEEFVE